MNAFRKLSCLALLVALSSSAGATGVVLMVLALAGVLPYYLMPVAAIVHDHHLLHHPLVREIRKSTAHIRIVQRRCLWSRRRLLLRLPLLLPWQQQHWSLLLGFLRGIRRRLHRQR